MTQDIIRFITAPGITAGKSRPDGITEIIGGDMVVDRQVGPGLRRSITVRVRLSLVITPAEFTGCISGQQFFTLILCLYNRKVQYKKYQQN